MIRGKTMYNLEDFEPYTLQKHLGDKVVLAWSRKSGYHFLTITQRLKATVDEEQFKIIGVLK